MRKVGVSDPYVDGVVSMVLLAKSNELEDEQAKEAFARQVEAVEAQLRALPESDCIRKIDLVKHDAQIKWRTAILVKHCPFLVSDRIAHWTIFTGRSEPISQHDADNLMDHLRGDYLRGDTKYPYDLAPGVTVSRPDRG